MSATSPNLISVLSSSSGVIGFLRPGPKGVMAYDSSGASLGLFETKAAAAARAHRQATAKKGGGLMNSPTLISVLSSSAGVPLR